MFHKLNKIIDIEEFVRRGLKYVLEALVVALVAYTVPRRALHIDEIGLIALVASAVFLILDTVSPSANCCAGGERCSCPRCTRRIPISN
jgi:hypothetical protein